MNAYVPDDVDSCHGGGDVMDDGGLELVVQLLSLQHPLQASHFLVLTYTVKKG
jgi:hypothetical protein